MKSLIVLCALVCGATLATAQTDNSQTLPPVTTSGIAPLNEEAPIGPNQQPEWTARRRFTTTRIYVQPPWQVETELGWDGTFPRHGGDSFHLFTQEIEVGLPYRLQVDYEAAESLEDSQGRYESSSFELRWALAEWGKILFNPTIKAEYKVNNGDSDAFELSLAFGDELAPRWHWGANLFYEHAVGGLHDQELAASAAISYSVIDDKLGIGIESKLSDENDHLDHHAHFVVEVGPSVQWRPTPHTHLDVVPLFGVTGISPSVEMFVFTGFDFGPSSEDHEQLSPASLRNK